MKKSGKFCYTSINFTQELLTSVRWGKRCEMETSADFLYLFGLKTLAFLSPFLPIWSIHSLC